MTHETPTPSTQNDIVRIDITTGIWYGESCGNSPVFDVRISAGEVTWEREHAEGGLQTNSLATVSSDGRSVYEGDFRDATAEVRPEDRTLFGLYTQRDDYEIRQITDITQDYLWATSQPARFTRKRGLLFHGCAEDLVAAMQAAELPASRIVYATAVAVGMARHPENFN